MRFFVFPIRALLAAAALQAGSVMAASLSAGDCGTGSTLAPSLAHLPESPGGYRVTAVRWDPLLRQRWAVVSACEHPERPPFTLPLQDGTGLQSLHGQQKPAEIPFPIVRAGDVVRVWSQEKLLRIEMAGVVQENGALGGTVRVHPLRLTTDYEGEATSGRRAVTVQAVVRGPHEVEIER